MLWYTINKSMEGNDIIQISDETKHIIHQIIEKENPRSSLFISKEKTFDKEFFQGTFQIEHVLDDCTETLLLKVETILNHSSYDMILVADLFESIPSNSALCLLKQLLKQTKKQILVIVPELCTGGFGSTSDIFRQYHPVMFCDFDFSYIVLDKKQQNHTQLYSFYPNAVSISPPPPSSISSSKSPQVLRLAYILPDQDLTGGMKQLLLQMQEMHSRGHQVIAYTKSNTASSAIPSWSNMNEDDIDEQHVLNTDEDYFFPTGSVDAVILGWMEQVSELHSANVPVILWEQGSSPIFGDFGELLASNSKERNTFRSYYQSTIHLMAVSPLVQKILKARFGRSSELVSAAIDMNTTQPNAQTKRKKQILLVGNGEKEFKNFSFVLQALVVAQRQGAKFDVTWITPIPPTHQMVPDELKVTYQIAPSPERLAMFYQSSDLFLSHSVYEAFSLPPLEAMAVATAVLAVNNGGIETYAVSGENCLLCEQGDMTTFIDNIILLLEDDSLRERLAKGGLATVGEYTKAVMCDELENCIRKRYCQL